MEMRKIMEKLRLIEQDINLDPSSLQIKVYDSYTDEEGGDYGDSITWNAYILQDGEKVGEIEYENYTGDISGKLFNKDLPGGLDRYSKLGFDDDPALIENGLSEVLQQFLMSERGNKWASNIQKYVGAKHSNDYRLK